MPEANDRRDDGPDDTGKDPGEVWEVSTQWHPLGATEQQTYEDVGVLQLPPKEMADGVRENICDRDQQDWSLEPDNLVLGFG